MSLPDLAPMDRSRGETGAQNCSQHCGRRSIPGMKRGQGLCAFHYAAWMWGSAWAQHCYPSGTKAAENEQSPPNRLKAAVEKARGGPAPIERKGFA